LIDAGLKGDAKHFHGITGNWDAGASVGIFWAWGAWGPGEYWYLTDKDMENLSKNNLYEYCRPPYALPAPSLDEAQLFSFYGVNIASKKFQFSFEPKFGLND
jgi:hypothetical protein